MKKRVLSALLALCMACTLAGNVWAAEETEPTPAPSAGVEAQTVEPQTVEPTPSAEPTQAPAPSPDATAEPEATPEPSVAPDPTVEPDVTPAPTEAPEATGAPAATATPDATAEPTATPDPTEAPAATATPEPSDAPEATAVPAVAYVAPVQTAEDQQINVHVDVPEGAFAENVAPTLHAQLITGETEEEQAELDKAAAQVAEQTGAAFDGMLALDVYFTDANAEDPEQEIEPALPVSVRFELSENVLPEGYDPATLAVHHLAEEKDAAGEPVTDENGETAVTVETVANAVTDDAEVPGVVALSDAAAEAAEAPAEVARIADLPAPETAATPADEQAAAEAEQALTDPAVVAEFEVESFSTFVLTYSSNRLSITVVNESYEEIGTNTYDSSESIGTSWTDVEDIASKIIEANGISEYEFKRAEYQYYSYGGAHKDDVNWIKYRTGSNSRFRYSSSEVEPSNDSNGDELNVNGYNDSHLYFIFEEKEETPQSGFYIDETIATDGRFTAKFSEGTEPQLTEGQYIQYTWKRGLSENAIDTDVKYTKATGTSYNMAAENGTKDATWVNVALDSDVAEATKSDRYWYEVTAQVMSADGTPVEGQTFTATLQVPYYIQLQNGSFENPNNEDYTENKYNDHQYQYENDTPGLIWKTTGEGTGSHEGADIEILRASTDQQKANAQQYHNCGAADDGVQFAELNCEAYGALYQEVMTVPGSTLNWAFSHLPREVQTKWSGRKGDTMALVIMPSDAADEYITRLQNNSKNPSGIENILKEIEQKGEENGYFVQRETSNYKYAENGINEGEHKANAWNRYNGTYKVGNDQYLTTFFFVAVDTGSTASNSETIGNLLDRVYFTSDPIPPDPDSANLTVTKKVEGLDLEEKSDYSVTVTVKGDEVNLSHTFNASDFDGNGEDEYTFVIDNISAGGSKNVTVTETATDMGDEYEVTQTVQVGEEKASNGTETSVTLRGEQSYTVDFTNTYEKIVPPEPVTPEFHKYIEDTDDGTYDLSLDVHGTIREDQNDPTKVDIVYVLDLSYSMMWDMNGTYPGGSDNTSGDDQGYDYTFARYNAATAAINTLNDALNKDGIDARAALITFAPDVITSDGQFLDVANWNNLPAAAWSTFASGTNYGAALNRAKSVISNARSDAQTVVIFITDGEPNRALDDHGQAVSANTNEATQYAENEVKDLNVDRFYAVGVGDDEYEDNLRRVVNAASNATEKHFYKSSNRDELAGIFQGIAADITSVDCTNVVITDTLSKYAQLTDDATFRVSITNAQGQAVNVTGNNVTVARATSGATVSFTSGDNEPVYLTVKYTPAAEGAEDNGTFTLTFPANYALENGWVYTITTDIEPTQEAYDEYAESGYGNTKGDLETDAPENNTSSDQPGFHSNDKATLVYTSAEQSQEKEYPHPVIQVKNGSLTIDKNVVSSETGFNVSALGDISFTFTVQGPDDVKGKTYGNVEFDENGVATVTIAKGGSLTIEELPAGDYTVTETGKPDSTDGNYYCSGTTYQVGNGNNKVNQPQAAPVSAGTETTVTVENTYAKYRTVTITKDVTGGMGDTSRFFNFTAQTGTENNKSNVPQTNMTAATTNPATAEVTDDGEFKLKDDGTNQGSVTINKVRQDETLTITEESVAGEGYTTTNTINGVSTTGAGNIATVTPTELAKGNVTVKFENDRPVVTPTGLESNHTKPYALMVGAGALAGLALVGGILARRARRRREW